MNLDLETMSSRVRYYSRLVLHSPVNPRAGFRSRNLSHRCGYASAICVWTSVTYPLNLRRLIFFSNLERNSCQYLLIVYIDLVFKLTFRQSRQGCDELLRAGGTMQ